MVGNWVTSLAASWVVYGLSGSAFWLGVASFASQAPTFFLSPLAGVWVDRLNRRRTLLLTQALAMLQSSLLAYFALRGTLDVPHVVALNLFQGLINVVDIPARQSFLVQLIDDRNDLPNAVALNSSLVNGARLVGPSLAALLIGLVGEAWCFVIDALSYLAVIGSLLAMRVELPARTTRVGSVRGELREALVYIGGSPPIRALLLMLGFISVLGAPYTVLLPLVAREVLHGGAATLGALTASAGLGALLGALYLASRSSVLGLGRLIAYAGMTFGCALVAVSHSRWLWLTLPLLAIVGCAMMVLLASSNTVLQTLVDEDKRGRVMSFYSMAVFGVVPFGSLLTGSLADRIGASMTLVLDGSASLLAAALFARWLPVLREHVRPIYERLGIVPQLARGVSEATRLSEPPPA